MEAKLQALDSEITSLYAEFSGILSQKELDEGISAVFGEKPTSPALPSKPRSRGYRCCRAVLVGLMVFLGVYICVLMCPPAERLVMKMLQPLSYQVVRVVRLLALPFVPRLQLTGWYGTQCMVSNPWAATPPLDCGECVMVKKVKTVSRPAIANMEYYRDTQPMVFTKAVEKNVSFADLQALYQQGNNSIKLDTGFLRFSSTSPLLPSIGSLLGDLNRQQLLEDSNFHVEWSTRGVPAARILRTLFPRPYFVPVQSEVSLEKTLVVDGPTANPYTMPNSGFTSMWYTQASGTRRLVFIPRDDCTSTCKTLQVVLTPGQLITYNDVVWRVDSVPYMEPGEDPEISLGFVGSYY